MGTIASRKFQMIVRNAESIVAMEFLAATQALDMLKDSAGKSLQPAGIVKAARDLIRKHVPFAESDRVFHEDIEAVRELIRSGELVALVKDLEF